MAKSRIAVILGICAALAVVGIIVWAAKQDMAKSASTSASGEQVRIEIRAMPIATVRVDGKPVGKTPMSLQFPKSEREVVIEATMQPLVYDMRTKQQVAEPVTETRRVKLDQDHLLDFKTKKPTVSRPEVVP